MNDPIPTIEERVEASSVELRERALDILRQIKDVNRNKRNVSEMIADMFDNDITARKFIDDFKVARIKVTARKNMLLATPAGVSLDAKKSDINSELRELKESLSIVLERYYQKTGTTELEIDSEHSIKFIPNYKVKADQLKLF